MQNERRIEQQSEGAMRVHIQQRNARNADGAMLVGILPYEPLDFGNHVRR